MHNYEGVGLDSLSSSSENFRYAIELRDELSSPSILRITIQEN